MFFPVMIDLKKMNIAIVGGGNISYRKAKKLLEYTDKIKIISPKICEEFSSLLNDDKVEILLKEFEEVDIEDCDLVYVATNNSELNQIISEYCLSKRILVNSVDNHENSRFIDMGCFKRTVEGEDVLVGVSCLGKNPKLVKRTKEKLEEYFELMEEDDEYR